MLKDKIIEIFVPADDFCISFAGYIRHFRLESNQGRHRNRKASLTDSEIIAILIFFHYGSFTNFKHYYNYYVREHLSDYFPTLVSYNRFIELQQRVAVPMMLFLKMNCLGKSRGINFIDSTPIKVCHNRRIHHIKYLKKWLKEASVPLDGSMGLNCILSSMTGARFYPSTLPKAMWMTGTRK
jgi:hypothetical protein